MTQKMQQSQMKRSLGNTAQFQQALQPQSNFEDVIMKIQQTINEASESIKQQLQQFQYQQLLNYKQDLFKTQDQFIKLKAQRNEDVVKNKIMQEKIKVEEKFSVQMKKSIEMNGKYEEMKNFMKKVTDEEAQLLLEINYVKKNLEKQLDQGRLLDAEIQELKTKAQSPQPIILSKINQETKLFTDLVNKCDSKVSSKTLANKVNKEKQNQLAKPESSSSISQTKIEKRLKQKIHHLKDYIQNIPLNLNFMENKIHQAIQNRKSKNQIKEDSIKEENHQLEGQNEVKHQQNFSTNQSDYNNSQKDYINKTKNEANKAIKLPNLKEQSKTLTRAIKSTQHLLNFPMNNKKIQVKIPKLPTRNKLNTQFSCKSYNQGLNDRINLLESHPKSSGMIQQILSDPEVKQYLYNLMFN